MFSQSKRLRWANVLFSGFGFVVLLLSCGCWGGTELGSVTGVVTLDGKPLENASVSFHPAAGRGSFGSTGADGRYELQYLKGRKGATLGTHKVTITTKIWAQPSRTVSYEESARDKKIAASKARPEMLPAKYRLREQTVLSAEVVKGKNEYDFALESK